MEINSLTELNMPRIYIQPIVPSLVRKAILSKLEKILTKDSCAEQKMWMGVIGYVIKDLGDYSSLIRRSANNYLDLNNRDFQTTCAFAGLVPEYVIRVINACKRSKQAARLQREDDTRIERYRANRKKSNRKHHKSLMSAKKAECSVESSKIAE